MESFLEGLADFQARNAELVILAAIVFTAGVATGIPDIQIQTDFQEGLPDDLPPIEAQDKVESEFRSSSSILILFQVEDGAVSETDVTDLRDPRMLNYLQTLETRLENEGIVSQASTPASSIEEIPETVENASNIPGSFYSRDFTSTQASVRLTETMSEENIREATRTINSNLEDAPPPAGVKATVTGNPVIRTDIGRILVSDSSRTILAASALILVLLSAARGLKYGPITFIPLFAGLIWTLGAMGHLGIPLTIATVALGAMILGLGVEYGSFITERIVEEKQEKTVEEAVKAAVPETGLAVLGSSTTTVVGFSALLLASISFIRNLGLTLSIGIILTVSSALIVTPSLVIAAERWSD